MAFVEFTNCRSTAIPCCIECHRQLVLEDDCKTEYCSYARLTSPSTYNTSEYRWTEYNQNPSPGWKTYVLGQHNFGFRLRAMSRFHGNGSETGHIPISHLCAWGWSEAGYLSHFILVWCLGCDGCPISHFIAQANQFPSQIGFWAEHLNLSPDNHHDSPHHKKYFS